MLWVLIFSLILEVRMWLQGKLFFPAPINSVLQIASNQEACQITGVQIKPWRTKQGSDLSSGVCLRFYSFIKMGTDMDSCYLNSGWSICAYIYSQIESIRESQSFGVYYSTESQDLVKLKCPVITPRWGLCSE